MSSVASASVDAGPRPIDPIVLQIGEKKFYTTRQTIAESSVLSSLVHLRDPNPEKPYFGHDIPLYHALQHQAEFYQIERLANWLLARAYLDAVSTKTWPKSVTLHGEQQLAHIDEMIKAAGRTFKILRIDQSRAKAFQCPNRNWRHDGLRSVFKVDLVILEVRIHQELVMPISEQPALPPPYQNTQ
uniref:BTB domain-containing protein n=1 Tax=Bionectria ochroleuca TaxID=29856 RepID=A0A8H7N9I5_BIOOC